MNWIPLRVIAKPVWILLLAISLFVLVRGHNEPGGGFIGGLLAASGILVYALAFSPQAARDRLFLRPQVFLGAGILTAAFSGLFGLFRGQAFLTGQAWIEIPMVGKLGSVLLFDLGVYLVVFGAAVQLMLWLLDADTQQGGAE